MLRETNATQRSYSRFVLVTALLILVGSGSAANLRAAVSQEPSCPYFKIQVVDRQTGRGVPLVELRTTNSIRYFTDSNGIIAFYEPGLMDQDVFFFVESHGYEFPKDGFGFRGTRLKTSRGASAVIEIDRLNIAERLYRVTGQGIYRDSILTGHSVPLRNPALNGQVAGQDSVFTCLYHGRLFWMWGDTGRPSYPLGNFATSGATSQLPENGGLDPAAGVDLEYFVDETGFSKPMSPLKEPGLVWLDGLLSVTDNEGRERMVAEFVRLKGLDEILERGLVVFNDATELFEPLVRGGVEFLPYSASGHPFSVDVDGQKYYYFATPFPLAVRMRVKAQWDDVIDANCYEALTALELKTSTGWSARRLDLGGPEAPPRRWVSFADLMGRDHAPREPNDVSAKTSVIQALEKEKQDVHLYDIESGKKISPHNGTVYFNAYRQRWVTIFVQQFGESSFLGELWYAEADTSVGPWVYTRKIITHNKYSFYNPKHHPEFDRDGGRIILFEGTYTFTFSGSAENATPRYDYNQIMYRLNLDDPRLALPVAVYQIRDRQDGRDYLLRDGVEKARKWDLIESVPFYAVEPARADANMVAVYAVKIPAKTGQKTCCFTVKCPDASAVPLFYALPPAQATENSKLKTQNLYEYCHADTGQRLYCTEPDLDEKDWVRTENPLCRVWKAPPETPLLDHKAKPTAR